MSSPPWFRFYSETLNDRKIERICRDSDKDIPKALVIGVWATILALANDSPERGALLLTDDIPLNASDLAQETGLDTDTMEALLFQFHRLKMLEMYSTDNGATVMAVMNWGKRQFVSDSSTQRVREHRERQEDDGGNDQAPGGNGSETLQDCYSNTPDTEQIQSKTETETENTAADAATPPEPSPKPPPKEPKPPTPAQEMFTAVAELCKIDLTLVTKQDRGKLNQVAKRLRETGKTPTHIAQFARYWYAADWRGQKGQAPTPHDIPSNWGRAKEWLENGGNNARRDERRTEPIDAGQATKRQIEEQQTTYAVRALAERAAAGASV